MTSMRTIKKKLSKQLFEEDIEDSYQVITKAHEEYEHDLSTDEVFMEIA